MRYLADIFTPNFSQFEQLKKELLIGPKQVCFSQFAN
jgi:hypothetical protein